MKSKLRILALCNPEDVAWMEVLSADFETFWRVAWCPSDTRHSLLNECEQRATEYQALLIPAHLRYQECPQAVDCGGIELLKHLRFLPLSQRDSKGAVWLTQMPCICTLHYSVAYYLRRAADNNILFSPGCTALPGAFGSRVLHDAVNQLIPCASASAMQRQLRPYAVATVGQEAEQEHSLRNKAGVLKFLTEFASHVIKPGLSSQKSDPFLENLKTVEDELWLCKLRFKNSFEAETCSLRHDTFVERCQQARFIYVDDQHREGWSYGLYAGLFFNTTDAIQLRAARDLLKNVEVPEISLADGRLLCIDNRETAKAHFSKQQREFNKALQIWADEDAKARADCVQTSLALQQAETSLQNAGSTDVVFLDMRLTGKDETTQPEQTSGVQLLESIKAKFPYISVIMLTASQKARSVKAAANADDFWVKAESSGEELRDAVTQALDLSLIRALWLRVRQVEARRELPIYAFNATVPSFELLSSANSEQARSEILQILNISLGLIRLAIQNTNQHDRDTYSRLIALNMGIIQENRLQTIQSHPFDAVKNHIPSKRDDELGLRAFRSKIGAHSAADLKEEIRPPLFDGNYRSGYWTVNNSDWRPLREFIGDPNNPNAKQPNLLENAVLGVFIFTLNQLLADF